MLSVLDFMSVKSASTHISREFRGIWQEQSLIDKEQKVVGEFFVLNSFLVVAEVFDSGT